MFGKVFTSQKILLYVIIYNSLIIICFKIYPVYWGKVFNIRDITFIESVDRGINATR